MPKRHALPQVCQRHIHQKIAASILRRPLHFLSAALLEEHPQCLLGGTDLLAQLSCSLKFLRLWQTAELQHQAPECIQQLAVIFIKDFPAPFRRVADAKADPDFFPIDALSTAALHECSHGTLGRTQPLDDLGQLLVFCRLGKSPQPQG
jgi:hypothetical protein